MIFDVNTAVGVWPFRNLRFAGNPKALYDHLAKRGITGGVTRHYGAPFCHDLDFINAELAKSVIPGFIPAFAVRPDYKQWKTIQAKAVALYPSFHNYKLTDPETLEMAKDLAGRNIVLHIIMREEDERSHHLRAMVPSVPAADVEAFADALPEAKIVLLNCLWGELSITCRHKNVYGEMASFEPFDVKEVLANLPGDQLLFGSHTPLYYTTAALWKLERAELDADLLAKIHSGNAAKLYC